MTIPRCLAAALAASLIFASPLAAQDEAQAPPPNPCESGPYTQFDFWVGHWDVHDSEGILQGHNLITKEENGCLVLERWTSVTGSTGQSYNYYDPGIDAWRQVWVSQGITIDYKGGVDASGAMVLFGDIAYRSGARYPFTGRWELLDDGAVKQSFQQYNPDAADWVDWFTGYYTLREDEAAD
ncbi:MAG: hypothetical protein AAF216_10765 [Pseudomonadota bacterium]